MLIWVAGISFLLQLVAAFLAWRLIRITRRRTAWLLLTSGFLLMALRRVVTLSHILYTDPSHPPDLTAELIGLGTSVVLLVGVAWIAPYFLALGRSQEALLRRDAILEAVGYAAEQFLRADVWVDCMQRVLERLGRAAQASRVYLFENHLAEDGALLTSQRYEWVAPGVVPQIDNPELQNFPLQAGGFARWEETLSRGGLIYGHIREFPESEREVLEAQNICSILIVPIFVERRWWGFIGFDECQVERDWSTAEVEALQAAAAGLGAAIQRRHAEEEARRRRAHLEALRQVGLELAAQLDLDLLLHSIVRRAIELVGGTAGGFYLYRSEQDALEWTVSVGPNLAPLGAILHRGEGLSGKVWESGQPLIVDDYKHWEGRADIFEDLATTAVVGVPVQWGEEFLGVLNVLTDPPRTFSPGDAEILSDFATQVATAIVNARLYTAERLQRELAEALAQAVAVVGSTLDLDLVLDRILEQVGRVIPHDAANILFVQGDEARVARWRGYERFGPQELVSAAVFRLSEVPSLRQMKETGQPMVIPDTVACAGWVHLPGLDWQRSYAAAPIVVRGELVGFLNVDSATPGFFTRDHLRPLQAFAAHAGTAIENARLYADACQRLAEANLLAEVMLAAASTLEFDQMVAHMLEAVHRALGMEFVEFLLPDESGQALLVHPSSIGFAPPPEGVIRVPLESSVTGRVYTTGQALLVADTQQISYYYPSMPEMRAEVAVPVRAGDQVIGVLNAEDPLPGAFKETDQRLLEAVAAQVGGVLRNARLTAALTEERERLALLYRLGQRLSASLDLRAVAQQALDEICATLGARQGVILVRDPDSDRLRLVAVSGYDTGSVQALDEQLQLQAGGKSLAGWVAATVQSAIVEDVARDDRWLTVAGMDDWARSALSVPLVSRSELVGVLTVISDREASFNGDHCRLVESAAATVASAIANARLYQEAQREIAERQQTQRALERRADQLSLLAKVGRQISGVLELDRLLDHIVNLIRDTFGYGYVTVLMIDPDTGGLMLRAGAGYETGSALGIRLQVGQDGICGWVAGADEPLLVNDVSQEPRFYPVEALSDVCSELAVPIRVRGEVVGVLDAESPQRGAFDEEDVLVLQTLADQIGVAVENARLYEMERERATRLRAVVSIAEQIASVLSLDEVLRQAVERITQVFGYPYVAILLLDEEADELVFQVGAGEYAGRTPPGYRQRVKEGMIGWAAHLGQTVWANDVTQEPRYIPAYLPQTRSELDVPLKYGERVSGVLTLQSASLKAFSPLDVLAMEALAGHLAAAIENARLYEAERRRAEELAVLHRAASAVASSLEASQVLSALAQHLGQALDATSVYIASWDEPAMTITVVAQWVGPRAGEGELGEPDLGAVYDLHKFPTTVRCLQEKQPLLLRASDSDLDPGDREEAELYGWRAQLLVPLVIRDRAVGCVEVWESGWEREFTGDEIRLCQTLAADAAAALEHARLFQAEQQRRQVAETLRGAVMALTSALDPGEVVERILAELQEVVPYDTASVQLLQEDRLEIVGGRGFPNLEELLGISFPLDGDNPNREVVRTRASFIVADASAAYSEFRRKPHAAAGIRSWLGVPMQVGERLIGMITLDKREPGYYTPEHARLAEAFAAQAAIALENSRLFAAEREQRELAEALAEAAAAVSGTLDLDRVLERILEQVERVVAGDAFNVMLVEGDTVRVVRWRGYERLGVEGRISHLVIPLSRYPSLVKVVKSGEPVLVPDTAVDAEWVREEGFEWLRCYVAAPIQVTGLIVGFLNVDGTRPGQFTLADAQRLQAFANHVATAMENARLYKELRNYAERLEERVRERTMQLAAQYAQLEAILRGTADGIVVIDGQGEILQANPVVQEWLEQRLSVGDAGRLREAVRELALRAAERPEMVLELTGLDLQLRAAPIEGGMEGTAVVAVHDVSHLRALDRMKSQFVSNVSHQLRTPVTTIRLYADLLRRRPDRAAEYIEALEQEAIRQARLVEDVLQISRIEAGRLEVQAEPTPLDELVSMAVANHRVLAESRGVRLEQVRGEGGPVALADPERMQEVLNNLIGNGIWYTPSGGRVEVRTAQAQAEGRAWATVTVSDTGIGMSQEDLEHLFERFYRGERARQMQIPGTGLGLAIVKEVVELHGGRVTVQSQEGQGSAFTVWLPLAE